MATSAVEISNIALIQLGGNPISSFEENSTGAMACSINWDRARRFLLRKHPWNFSIKRIELARAEADPIFRYRFKYALPSDCLRVLTVYQNPDYKVERRFIYTDTEDCFLKYVYDNKDVPSWDASFVDLMVAKLTADIAYTITRDKGIKDQSVMIFEDLLLKATGVDASEDIEDVFGQFDNDLIRSRF